MKIIISHDVDHLYGKDHWFRDLIYPKLWLRSTLQLLKRQITIKEWFLRCISCFQKKRHRLEAVMAFDKEHGVPSTFFFGMAKGLGMSYKPCEAKNAIAMVNDNGFDVGVHGINYQDKHKIKEEYDTFVNVMGYKPCGLRMHYVRFNENTFDFANQAGYVFDSTEFDKPNGGTIKEPYKVGDMWEFPLAIMDGYLPMGLEKAKKKTLEKIEECKRAGLEYVTILFHDYQFCEAYQNEYKWYRWIVELLSESKDCEFVSYKQAMAELEARQCKK